MVLCYLHSATNRKKDLIVLCASPSVWTCLDCSSSDLYVGIFFYTNCIKRSSFIHIGSHPHVLVDTR